MTRPIDEILDEAERSIYCTALELSPAVYEAFSPRMYALIAVARAAAEEVIFDTGCDCIICTALRALTEVKS